MAARNERRPEGGSICRGTSFRPRPQTKSAERAQRRGLSWTYRARKSSDAVQFGCEAAIHETWLIGDFDSEEEAWAGYAREDGLVLGFEVGLPGTQIIEFSPAGEYDQTLAVVGTNLEASTGRGDR